MALYFEFRMNINALLQTVLLEILPTGDEKKSWKKPETAQ